MGTALESYRAIVQQVLEVHAAIPPGAGTAESFVLYDPAHDHFLLMSVGWNGYRRIHSLAAHLVLRDGKVWIEHDGTPPPGLAAELVQAGIPETDIVLAFHPPEKRPHAGFAVA